MKALLLYIFGCFSGVTLMCIMFLAKKSDEVYIKDNNNKEKR